ncbi:MAG: transcription termination factor NusA [Planctomycetota bacterium]
MNPEILRLVDTIHRDKEIDKEVIFQGIEAALLSAAKKKLGETGAARVIIDRVTGDTKTVDENDNEVVIPDLGRIAAMTGKQVLFQRIREAECEKIYNEYEARLGKIVTGVVQRAEGPNLIVNLGKVEAILPRSEQAPGERFRVGERIKVLVKEVKRMATRVRIVLSRASPLFVKALFEIEVPEIGEKVIEIVDIVREPGYRTKIAVATYDNNVDCVGACVGVRGSRIKNIVDELFGEKIDIVRWNESIEVLIMNALKPAEITSMDLDYDQKKAVIYVKPEQQSLAIGKRGQNVRLASKLSKWELDIVTVSEEDIEKLRKGGTPASLEVGAAARAESSEPGVPPAEGGQVEAGETAASETAASETAASETAASETEASETAAPESAAPEGAALDSGTVAETAARPAAASAASEPSGPLEDAAAESPPCDEPGGEDAGDTESAQKREDAAANSET